MTLEAARIIFTGEEREPRVSTVLPYEYWWISHNAVSERRPTATRMVPLLGHSPHEDIWIALSQSPLWAATAVSSMARTYGSV